MRHTVLSKVLSVILSSAFINHYTTDLSLDGDDGLNGEAKKRMVSDRRAGRHLTAA